MKITSKAVVVVAASCLMLGTTAAYALQAPTPKPTSDGATGGENQNEADYLLDIGPSTLPLGAKVPETTRQTEEEELASLEALKANSFNWEHRETASQLQALGGEYPDVASLVSVDPNAKTIQATYVSGSDPVRLEAYLAQAREIAAVSPFPVEFTPVGYSQEQQMAAVEDIATNSAKYEKQFGGLAAAVMAENDGSIYVRLEKGRSQPLNTEVAGFKVLVDSLSAQGEAQGRALDSSPSTGGIRSWSALDY